MRKVFILIAGGILGAANAWSGANCQHSASWQCGAHHGGAEQGSQTGSGIATTGHSPDPGTTNPHLGTVDTGVPQAPVAFVPAQAIPPQPPEQKIPVPQKQQVPPQIMQKEPQPMKVPPQPPEQKIPVPQKQKTPPEVLQKVPLLATPHPTDVHTGPVSPKLPPVATAGQGTTGGTVPTTGKPHSTVALPHKPGGEKPRPQVVTTPGKPTPLVIGGQLPEGHTHYLVPTAPNGQLPYGIGASVWVDEVVEPGIQNQRVELYRSNDAAEVLYKDAIPMDKAGFHLKVVGTRPPNYH